MCVPPVKYLKLTWADSLFVNSFSFFLSLFLSLLLSFFLTPSLSCHPSSNHPTMLCFCYSMDSGTLPAKKKVPHQHKLGIASHSREVNFVHSRNDQRSGTIWKIAEERKTYRFLDEHLLITKTQRRLIYICIWVWFKRSPFLSAVFLSISRFIIIFFFIIFSAFHLFSHLKHHLLLIVIVIVVVELLSCCWDRHYQSVVLRRQVSSSSLSVFLLSEVAASSGCFVQ